MNKHLSVFILNNAPEDMKAKMRRYFYEVQVGVFCGTSTTSIKNVLWKEIENRDIDACVITQAKNTQGFKFNTTRPDVHTEEEFAQIIKPVKATPIKKLALNQILGKINPSVPLMQHILDVGYLAEAYMTVGRGYNLTLTLSKKLNIDFNTLVDSISFICALHDIGKAHPYFISNMYRNAEDVETIELFNNLVENKIIPEEEHEGFRHERFSRDIVKKYFSKKGYGYEDDKFAVVLAYHHQGKDGDFTQKIELEDAAWLQIHDEILEKVESCWSFSAKMCEDDKYADALTYSILSILVISDWIASGTEWHDMVEGHRGMNTLALAKMFMRDNELHWLPMHDRLGNVKWADAFKFDQNAMQKAVIEVTKDNPQFMIIEYPCGGGKTEAALAAATIIGRNKSGIFLATPTMATAKGMAQRMNVVTKNIGLNLTIPEMDSSVIWSDNDMNKIPQYLWTSKTRHNIFYPFAVGTVDQLLRLVLEFKYSCLGISALADKVIIIDEVHAYDSYMLTELKRLIQWCTFMEVPIILLSATLPTVTKNSLLEAAGCKDKPKNNEYPLITTYRKFGSLKTVHVPCESTKLKIRKIYTDDCAETFKEEMNKDYPGCTAFVERTVDDTYELNRYAVSLSDKNAVIFHGRDTMDHKEQKTLALLKLLGKDRTNRPKKMTLVATPIIEQSLDIDLDRMVTSISPIDLLIQRFGRVWRHDAKGTIREKQEVEDPITIIIPSSFNRLTYIYDTEILRRTIAVLEGRDEIDTVKDARMLIDTVYDTIELVNNFASDMRASYQLIGSPYKDGVTILANERMAYSKFSGTDVKTREENYPTEMIALIDPKMLNKMDYQCLKTIMQKKVVSISTHVAQSIHATVIPVENGLLSTIKIYDENEMRECGFEITEYGLLTPKNIRIDKK